MALLTFLESYFFYFKISTFISKCDSFPSTVRHTNFSFELGVCLIGLFSAVISCFRLVRGLLPLGDFSVIDCLACLGQPPKQG